MRVWDAASLELIGEPFARSAFDARAVLFDRRRRGGRRRAGAPARGADRRVRSADRVGSRTAQIVDAAWGSGTLATLAFDQRLQLWSEAAEPTAIVLGDQDDGAFGLAASPDGSRFAVGDGDGSVVIYDPATGDEEQGFRGLHDGAVLDSRSPRTGPGSRRAVRTALCS